MRVSYLLSLAGLYLLLAPIIAPNPNATVLTQDAPNPAQNPIPTQNTVLQNTVPTQDTVVNAIIPAVDALLSLNMIPAIQNPIPPVIDPVLLADIAPVQNPILPVIDPVLLADIAPVLPTSEPAPVISNVKKNTRKARAGNGHNPK